VTKLEAFRAIKAVGCRVRFSIDSGEYAVQLLEDTDSFLSGVNWYLTDDRQDAVDTAKAMRLRHDSLTAQVAAVRCECRNGTNYVNDVRLTATRVNAELKKLGFAERLRQGRGYCYFTEAETSGWYSSSVAVCYVSDLSIALWVEELQALRASAKADGRSV
jgi:hypothetical protein